MRRIVTTEISAFQRSPKRDATFGDRATVSYIRQVELNVEQDDETAITYNLQSTMFGVTFTKALREALPTAARCSARLPPIPVGPSSSRWASSYVHLGDLADNKGAREDVSQPLAGEYSK